MEAHFEMLPEDLAAFRRYWRKQWNWRSWGIARSVLLALIVIVQITWVHYVLHQYVDEPDFSHASLLIVGSYFVAWIAIMLLYAINPNTSAERFKGSNKEIHVRIDAEWLHYSNPITMESRRWKALNKIGITDDHAFFFTRPNAAYILPRRAFANREAYRTFVDTARGYYDAAKAFRDDPYEETA